MSWLKIRAFAILFCASFVLQFLHLAQFLLIFGTGILFQTVFYLFQDTFYGTQSPFGLESLITLITVSLGAAVAVDKSKKIYSAVNYIAIKHPILFFTLPNTICIIGFLLCFAYITREFFTVTSMEYCILYKDWDTCGSYILCASYIVYVVTTICYKDRNFIRDRITGHECCQFVAFIVANLIQAATVFGILKPLQELLMGNLAHYNFHAPHIFGYMLFMGLLMGIAAGVLEKYAHCVVHKRRAPFYWYENSVEARNCILQLLAFPIHYGFFKPAKSLPILSTDEHFFYFSTYSSLALMQFSKILYMIMFDHKNLDVVCGYSSRTSARDRRLSRTRSRSPRGQSSRSRRNGAQEESVEHYEGECQNDEEERNNNPISQQSRKTRALVKTPGKPDKIVENSTSFLGMLFPIELPIIFMTSVVMKIIVKFVFYAEKLFGEAYPVEIEVGEEPDILMENLPSSSKATIPASGIQQEQNKNKSADNSEGRDYNENEEEINEIFQRGDSNARVFGDIEKNHISGDNIIQPVVKKTSTVVNIGTETKRNLF